MMTFYHGSPIGELSELKPFLSEHGKPYIYFAANPLIALLYAVKPVPKPFSFYPYGFDESGNLIYSEYFEDAFHELYKGKTGYLYECRNLENAENPTQINCAYTVTNPVKTDSVTAIPDLYEYFKEQEKNGKFSIKRCSEISEKEMSYVLSELKKDIEKYKLKDSPDHEMSAFIKTHFPSLWE